MCTPCNNFLSPDSFIPECESCLHDVVMYIHKATKLAGGSERGARYILQYIYLND